MKGATIFSGGEGVGVGMRAAGIQHLWGIEYDNSLSEVARANGFISLTADVRGVDPSTFERPNVLHASPECKRASTANQNATETEYDRQCAEAVCRFIHVQRPDIFSLENVFGYRHFESFKMILRELRASGYHVAYWHLNSADWGVPQTRKRMILLAALDFTPGKPRQTHAQKLLAVFDTLLPWVGWYEAIEDLIPNLPGSEFANWQIERLPKEIRTWLVGNDRNGDARDRLNLSRASDPAFCVVSTNGSKYRAFILDSQNGHGKEKAHVTRRASHEPAPSLSANSRTDSLRAYLVNGGNANRNGRILRDDGETRFAIVAQAQRSPLKAWLGQGRVVKMTPRALARFQAFPDSYQLPDVTSTACTVIGNAVPPLWYEKIIRQVAK